MLTCYPDSMVPIGYWAFLECEVSIIAARVPAIRALFTKSAFFQSSTRVTEKYGYGRSNANQVESKDIQVVTSVGWASDSASKDNIPEQETV
jgi:hypothetical protein